MRRFERIVRQCARILKTLAGAGRAIYVFLTISLMNCASGSCNRTPGGGLCSCPTLSVDRGNLALRIGTGKRRYRNEGFPANERPLCPIRTLEGH
jgi:hypothetical protein